MERLTCLNARVGGKGSSTSDHLKIINTYIKTMRKQKKTVFITFLDIPKAYDKAWLKAIVYSLHKIGISGQLLRIAKKLNENLSATTETKYGDTRTIYIKDSIRHGGVLAVVAYANLMDEITKDLKNLNPVGDTKKPGCLLWMDDVVLLHTDKNQMHQMLNTTHDIASRYRIKFGTGKSKCPSNRQG